MVEAELVRDRGQANPATNPAGLTPMDRSSKLTNNNSFQKNHPIHQIQKDYDVNWIVIENDLVHDETNSYFEQIRQPNGDIYLRLVHLQ